MTSQPANKEPPMPDQESQMGHRRTPGPHVVAPETCLDGVGRTIAVGDTVWAVVGTRGSPSRVERLSHDRVVVRREDGMVAVLRLSSVVGLRPMRPDSGVAS